MIGSTRAVRVFAYAEPVDMRKSYNGLEAIVRDVLGYDLLQGDMFLFVSRNRTRAKVLLFDGTGLCIYMKRMEKGLFASLESSDGQVRLTMSELALFMEGATGIGKKRLSPPPLTLKDLAPYARA